MITHLAAFLAMATVLPCSMPVQTSAAGSFIRVVQDRGTWWLEDGRGQKFFSLGVNCIGGCFGHAESSAMEASRKERIVDWLVDLGFNTAAGWSSPSVWDRFYFADQIYTGFKEDRDDAFDESLWRERFEPCIREEVKPFLGKENFIGYFIDNEPKWIASDVFGFYRGLSREKPGGRAFIAFLRSYYGGSLERLNREWGASYRDFEDIAGSTPAAVCPASMEAGILRAWRNEVARTYYGRYVSLVRRLDPDHLILGVRYRSIPELDLFQALSPLFDVESVNEYNRYGQLKPEFEALYRASGKPLMITEFSFSGFPEPGRRSMLFVDVYTQENRGLGYRKYVLEAARAPYMLGMHWFFWMDYPRQDEASGGFLPDENVGLVTADESRTYEELAGWIRRANPEVHGAHLAAGPADPRAPEAERKDLAPFTPKVDGDLSDWPREAALKPSTLMSLRDDAVVDHAYYLSHDENALYAAGDVSDSHLENPGGEWFWTGDCLFLNLSREGPGPTDVPRDLSLFIYPVGGGPTRKEPLATRWLGHEKSRLIPAEIALRHRSGRLAIEARIPWSSLENFSSGQPGPWKMKLGYQNAGGICQGYWTGIVRFAPR